MKPMEPIYPKPGQDCLGEPPKTCIAAKLPSIDKSSSRPAVQVGTRVIPARSLNEWLKVELPGEFDQTRTVDGRRDRSSAQFAEIDAGWVRTDTSELWMIEEVGRVEAKLEAKGFGEVEILSQTRRNRVDRRISNIAKRLRIKSVANGEIVINAVLRGVGGSGNIVVTRQCRDPRPGWPSDPANRRS